MTLDKSTLYKEVDSFTYFPDKIEQLTVEEFQKVYGSEEAKLNKNIVYMLLSEKPIPRLIGESRILYIGQTKNSFRTRYYRYAEHHATTKANSFKFGTILNKYGPIQVAVKHFEKYGDTLAQSEGQLLWWYFQNHGEYPPINYTKTKVRKDVVSA
jgi:hypothetical protein